MKNPFSALRKRLREPKWRHGKLGALLLICFLAACTLINIGVKALEDEYGWSVDLSFNGYATTGEETARVLGSLQNEVELYLLYQSGQADERLTRVLDRYAVMCERISVLPTDINKNPGVVTRFGDDAQSAAEADSVVVSCEQTGRYKVIGYDRFFTQAYNIETGQIEVEGLAYEKELTEAIVYVTQAEVPTLGLLQGHGELTAQDMSVFTDFLKSNGYDSGEVNLLRDDTLESVDLLVIAGARKDITDEETNAIAAFAQGGGSILYLRDYTDPVADMPNMLALLRSYGVVPLNGLAVASEDAAGDYYQQREFLLPYMCETELTQPLIVNNLDVLLLPGACAFETPEAGDNSLIAETVLKTGKDAYLRDLSDGGVDIERREGDRTGEMSLAIMSVRTHATGDISRMFAIGNSTLFTDEYMYSITSNEEFIVQLMGALLPQKAVSLDIMASTAFRPALRVGSQTLGVALLAATPLVILIAALCVLLPRKNR